MRRRLSQDAGGLSVTHCGVSAKVDLKFQASPFDPSLYFIFRGRCDAVRALATRIDDVPGCEEPDVLLKAPKHLGRRFGGGLKLQEQSFVSAGMEISHIGSISRLS